MQLRARGLVALLARREKELLLAGVAKTKD